MAAAVEHTLTNLTNGTYECVLTSGPFTATVSALVLTAFTDTVVGSRALRSEWPPVAGALAYEVQWRVKGDGEYRSLPQRTVVEYAVLSGLQPLTTHELKISATTGRDITSRPYYSDEVTTTEPPLAAEYETLALQVSVKTVASPIGIDGTFTLYKVAVLYLPKDAPAATEPREVDVTLPSGASATLIYDGAANSVTVDGTEYFAGDTILVQDQRVLLEVQK